MINTLYNAGNLGIPLAFLLALLIGVAFGFVLERAGFSSSRRLAGVFYFTDMAVVKVMFTALLTALLGLSFLAGLNWLPFDRLYFMPTVYGAQIAGGLVFGVGFVMGGWCPGTAPSGVASGKIDALVFLIGAAGGSILFNELFPVIQPLYTAGDRGVQTIYENLDVSRNVFIFLFTLMGVMVFWLCEWIEKKRNIASPYLGSPFLKAFSVAFIAIAGSLFILSPASPVIAIEADTEVTADFENQLMANIDAEEDHIEPEELADRLLAGDPNLVLVDVRPAAEFASFHIKGAINIPLEQLAEALAPYKGQGIIVLYSNGMTHPAQARDSLQRRGFDNAYMLTDGIIGFRERCLKPVSLRAEPLNAEAAARVNAWRAFFIP